MSAPTPDIAPPKSDVVAIPVEEKTAGPPEIGEREITPVILRGWLQRARQKCKEGLTVLRVTSAGKLVRRTVYVDAKPEYFEITSAKLFDLGYHMSEIADLVTGCDSPDFEAFGKQTPDRLLNPTRSCIVRIEGRTISLVFKTVSDRRDFTFLMRVQMKALRDKYGKRAAS